MKIEAARESQAQIFWGGGWEKTTALRGIFCKQGWYSVARHFQLTSIKGYFRYYIQMIVNPAKYMEPHLRTYNFNYTEIKLHLNSE